MNADELTIPERMVRLEGISKLGGRKFARLEGLLEAESSYRTSTRMALNGYATLLDAATCFFLDVTIEMPGEPKATAEQMPKDQFGYRNFVARLVNTFHALRASQIAALDGYPFSGYTVLRNVFDSMLCTCAVVRGVCTFADVEGIPDGLWDDEKLVRRRRKETEQRIRKQLVGEASGLSQTAIAELRKWNDMFDYETHGSRLSMGDTLKWLRGEGDLQVSPELNLDRFALYMNRHCELGWMFHRLIPLCQIVAYSGEWRERWRIIDSEFRLVVEGLTTELYKPIGAAISELVDRQFSFSEMTLFPL